ncbi:MAG: hypothetical protein WCL28_05170 [bacterium]
MQKEKFFGVLGALGIFLVACSDAAFNGSGGSSIDKRDKTCSKPPCNKDEDEFKDGDPRSMLVRYGKDIKPSVADYLFVLDNSVSMGDDATKVGQGLAAIAKETFPESTRIAVMTTMAAADPYAASLVAHADIDVYACINREPGFLSFVDKASVDAFNSCDPPAKYANKYVKTACEFGWFKPFDVNSAGDRCFTAALQNSFHAVVCEPGLLALEQLLKRNQGKPLFRENAAVSVIFISDEQEGCTSSETLGDISNAGAATTASRLKDEIFKNSKVLSVKFNGIVPNKYKPKPPAKEPLFYVDVINAVGGKAFDIKSPTADYNSMIEQLIQAKVDNTASEFSIPATAKKVTGVEVDGVVTSGFTFDASRSKVSVQGLDPNKTVDIRIRFE